MKNVVHFVLVLLAASCGSCASTTPVPDPAPTPDPSADVYEAACSNLATWGCSEGLADNCADTIKKTQEGGLVDLKPSCLANAKSVGEIQACGSVECVASTVESAATCANACANLKKLGCKEGVDTSCTPTCQKMVAKKIVTVPLSCLAKAKTKAAARACGGVDCP